jgi:hypothetical protein
MTSGSSEALWPTAAQIEAFRREHHIPDDGKLEPWAVEENMVLAFLCSLAASATAAMPTDTDPQGTKRLFLGPTPEMIEAGAQRLVRWETGEEKWPDAWSKMDVRAARNDAEKCWLSMWLAAPSFVSEKRIILDPSVYDETDQHRARARKKAANERA